MKEPIVLEGLEYSGRFKIEEHYHRYSEEVSTEVGKHVEWRTSHWFEGEGIIKFKPNGAEQRFLVYPDGNNETDLVMIRKEYIKRIQAFDIPRAIDLALSQMYEDAQKSTEIIPKIRPRALSIDRLLEKGILPPK